MNLNFDEEIKKEKRKKRIKECIIWFAEITVIVLLAYFLVHFCFKKVSTIGSTMEPTLYNGEEVLINTKAYLVFSPHREDVIAFYDTEDDTDSEEESLIAFRRIIGLPGEKIQIIDGEIWINEKKWTESYTYVAMNSAGVAEQEITLGEDEYFVLCDSRVDLDDSRNASFGMIKKSQIIGKVSFRLEPFSHVTGPDSEAYETAEPQS